MPTALTKLTQLSVDEQTPRPTIALLDGVSRLLCQINQLNGLWCVS